jgi:hypothetical protein
MNAKPNPMRRSGYPSRVYGVVQETGRESLAEQTAREKAGKPNRDRLERESGSCSEEVPGDDVLVGSVVPLLGLEVRNSELFRRTQVVSLDHEQKREISTDVFKDAAFVLDQDLSSFDCLSWE